MSFVNIKEFRKLEATVAELEARIRALEGYEAAESPPELEPIPTIAEAVVGPSIEPLSAYLDKKIADLLVDSPYDTVAKVNAASVEELQAINGIGAATVKRIREALDDEDGQ